MKKCASENVHLLDAIEESDKLIDQEELMQHQPVIEDTDRAVEQVL